MSKRRHPIYGRPGHLIRRLHQIAVAVGNNSAEARGRRSPFVGAASSGPMVWIRQCSCRGYAMSVHGTDPRLWPSCRCGGSSPGGAIVPNKRTAFAVTMIGPESSPRPAILDPRSLALGMSR
jgi:hypothetical protein